MPQPLLIGIDIGTQGTKTVLCDRTGRVLADAFEPSQLIRPGDGSVYEEPERLFGSVVRTVRAVTEQAGDAAQQIAALAMDAQMAGLLGIGADFEAVTPLDSWLDSRCAPYTEHIRREAEAACIRSSGGPVINAHAPKILWWKHERPEAYARIRKFVMPNGYIAGRLCGLKAEDAFMDYTFLHFNSFSDNPGGGFNEELLRLFGVAPEKLPRVVAPTAVVGQVTDEYADACGLPRGVKVAAGCGDTAASSLGAGITRPGVAYDVAGTASVFACATDRYAPDTAHKTILFARSVIEGLYIPLAYISGGGICLKWFAGLCGRSLRELDELAAQEAPGCGGITFIPHFSGRTCPLDNDVRGAILGLHGAPSAGRRPQQKGARCGSFLTTCLKCIHRRSKHVPTARSSTQRPVQAGLYRLVAGVLREDDLGDENLLGRVEHLALPGGESPLPLALRQPFYDGRNLHKVSTLYLHHVLAVALVPVLRHADLDPG